MLSISRIFRVCSNGSLGLGNNSWRYSITDSRAGIHDSYNLMATRWGKLPPSKAEIYYLVGYMHQLYHQMQVAAQKDCVMIHELSFTKSQNCNSSPLAMMCRVVNSLDAGLRACRSVYDTGGGPWTRLPRHDERPGVRRKDGSGTAHVQRDSQSKSV